MTVELKNTSGGKRAGDVEYFPSGRQTYLAPLPLPTNEHPFCPYISGYNDTFLDFGGGEPNVFSYQIWLGGPFTCSCLVAFGGAYSRWFFDADTRGQRKRKLAVDDWHILGMLGNSVGNVAPILNYLPIRLVPSPQPLHQSYPHPFQPPTS